MEQTEVAEISRKIQDALKATENVHEAAAWANALRSFMVAVGISNNLEKLPNA